MMPVHLKRMGRALACGALTLLLSGCFLSPGTFTSRLQVNDDGRFAYFYDGEITILGLGEMARMGANAADDDFVAEPCISDNGSVRECSAAELDRQRSDWAANAPGRAAERAQQAQMVQMMIGEVDLSDPQKIEEFTRKLERQAGWNRVEHRADGVFDVSFAIDGMLNHDFLFPVIEGFPLPGAFVQVYVRDENMIRIEAPGFSASAAGPGAGMGGFTQLMGMAARADESGDRSTELPNIPPIDGTFTITTNATILANNTDEGPRPSPTGNVLAWSIDQQTAAAPTALLRLNR